MESAFHLTLNFAYPLMIVLSILMFPAMVIRYNMGWYEMMIVDVPLFLGATMSVCSFYVMSQREVFGDTWKSRLRYMPAVLAVGIGLTVSNAKGVMEAVFGIESEFTRTPKYGVEGASDDWRQKRYRGASSCPSWSWRSACTHGDGVLRGQQRDLQDCHFILLFQFGFLYAALLALQGIGKVSLVREQEA